MSPTYASTMKDCTTFKGWLESTCQYGAIMLPKECLIEQTSNLVKVINKEPFNPL